MVLSWLPSLSSLTWLDFTLFFTVCSILFGSVYYYFKLNSVTSSSSSFDFLKDPSLTSPQFIEINMEEFKNKWNFKYEYKRKMKQWKKEAGVQSSGSVSGEESDGNGIDDDSDSEWEKVNKDQPIVESMDDPDNIKKIETENNTKNDNKNEKKIPSKKSHTDQSATTPMDIVYELDEDTEKLINIVADNMDAKESKDRENKEKEKGSGSNKGKDKKSNKDKDSVTEDKKESALTDPSTTTPPPATPLPVLPLPPSDLRFFTQLLLRRSCESIARANSLQEKINNLNKKSAAQQTPFSANQVEMINKCTKEVDKEMNDIKKEANRVREGWGESVLPMASQIINTLKKKKEQKKDEEEKRKLEEKMVKHKEREEEDEKKRKAKLAQKMYEELMKEEEGKKKNASNKGASKKKDK